LKVEIFVKKHAYFVSILVTSSYSFMLIVAG